LAPKIRNFYLIVFSSIIAGAFLGSHQPQWVSEYKMIADLFVETLKTLVPSIIFLTMLLGILKSADVRSLGRLSLKAILYFEVVSTFALALGLIVGNILRPGENLSLNYAGMEASALGTVMKNSELVTLQGFFFHLLRTPLWESFAGRGDLFQIFLLAVLSGLLLKPFSKKGVRIIKFFDLISHFLFAGVSWLMLLAPFAAGAAMAFSVGKFGGSSLWSLGLMMLSFYGTCGLFIVVVLGLILKLMGLRLFSLLRYLKEELVTVLGTSSSESALAPLMQKLKKLGCDSAIVGFVVPTGYSFNLDGTNIYLTLSVLFLAQACHVELSLERQIVVLFVGMLTSKGAAGVTGSGFVTLAATLSLVPEIPIASMALLLGIDRFMSETRALTNFIGNAVATLVLAKSEGKLDQNQLQMELSYK
jgi:aerobic C4-dicarboxylate transport protein